MYAICDLNMVSNSVLQMWPMFIHQYQNKEPDKSCNAVLFVQLLQFTVG